MLASLMLVSLLSSSFPPPSPSPAPSPVADATEVGGLDRAAFLGARLNVVPDEARQRLKLEAPRGAAVDEVFPDSSADHAGLKAGDIVVSLNGRALESPAALAQGIAGLKAGAEVTLEYYRGDTLEKKTLTLRGRPLETSDAYEVVYGAVPSRAGRLRTILTRPKGEGKHPALFLIQGIGTFSVDNPVGPIASYRTFADHFTRKGFVTLRVDKPGCGDSEGGPARDVDFDTELDGYTQALKMLRGRDDVDPDRIFVLGHSMGGVMAPLAAAEVPVKGIIAYGTLSRTWVEYMLENIRRQMELAGEPAGTIDRQMRTDAQVWTLLCLEGLTPPEIAARSPQLRERLKQFFADDAHFAGRSVSFYRQLAARNLGEAWSKFPGHALAIWGKGDYVSNEDDHALIARIVNARHPGHGTFLAMAGIDHGFTRAGTPQESLASTNSAKPAEFNPAILDVCREWIEKTGELGAGGR